MEPEQMEFMKETLAEHRGHLRSEILTLGSDPDSDSVEVDLERGFSDSARSTDERARLISVAKALRDNLREVDRALAKMDLGTYGVCERCGQPIGDDRLEALPWAILCIGCKQKGLAR